MPDTVLVILILGGIGVLCGILIFVVNRVLPKEPGSLKKAQEILENLPNMNCGACGFPGCFAYAQALAEDKNTFFSNTCATVMQQEDMLHKLEEILDIKMDPSVIDKKAVVKCFGNSKPAGRYNGIKTCRSASKIAGGSRVCPYGCLGYGDCVRVCPNGAIYIDPENKVAVVDPGKCNGCGLCVKECPRHLIELVPSNTNIIFRCSYEAPRNIPNRPKCDLGCLGCKKCFKVCENGAILWNEEKAMPEFDMSKCVMCGKCIEVCPHNRLIALSNITKKQDPCTPDSKESVVSQKEESKTPEKQNDIILQ
ncbi:MAG: 4Fe-4S binding protein [Actinobacteria bacterium]|nr:4Fe-4S binding protein [Actinomycetota bacterium]